MNGLLLDRLQQSGQLKAGKYDLDFDHEFIPTEKYDAKYSHKKERGYFSGIATIGEMLVAIENRDANTNVRFHQKETLANIFERLARRGLFIDRCRMDCGSFSEETIRMVHEYCSKFYIRDSRCQTLYERMSEIENWNAVEINFEKYKSDLSTVLKERSAPNKRCKEKSGEKGKNKRVKREGEKRKTAFNVL